ncbi:MAG: hypothetical protein A2176_01575 [Spirochaetes bacterium RBG_13_51_14]|nr:MAG: hypothetical protein A2176_01575 [Spirochaetes bacterium RBG_13_51_14]
MLDTVRQIDDVITKNFKNYPAAFALSNVGGYPIGDAYIGNFPHMFFGVSMTIGCANMKYFDEDVRRETSVYPAYAPNPVLYLGLGLAGGFDLLIKAMVFSDAMYRPPLDQESATLSKFNIYSGGGKLRKNLIGPITVLPGLFGFGGFTVSAGADFMEGIIGINGHYKYRLNNVFVNPPGAYYSLDFDAFYNFNCKWSMVAANAQAIGYINFLWVFDLYAGFGLAMTWGYTKLDASGLGTVSNPSLGSLGIIKAAAGYKYYPKFFMGLFIAGLEVNIWVLKVTAETMVNISNGHDISLQLGTRVQF